MPDCSGGEVGRDAPIRECLRSNGDHRVRFGPRWERTRIAANGADRWSDREHASVRAGRVDGGVAGGSGGGAVHRRGWGGEGVPGSSRADGGAFRGGPAWRERRKAVPDGGPSEVEG